MNWKTLLLGSSLAAVAGFGFTSCGQETSAAANVTGGTSGSVETDANVTEGTEPVAATELTPDPDAVLARAFERWTVIAHDDWIQAYEYLRPERKKMEKITHFLQGKENHQYRNPTKPKLIAIEGDEGYVVMEVVWTPLHPEIYAAENIPEGGMTQTLNVVETWVWTEGVWYWDKTERVNDFLEAHPGLELPKPR